MSYTILIFNWHPENIQIFKIPDGEITTADNEMFTKVHGEMINCVDLTEALDYVQSTIQTSESGYTPEFEISKLVIGKFVPFLVYAEDKDRNKPINLNCEVTRIISTGFAL